MIAIIASDEGPLVHLHAYTSSYPWIVLDVSFLDTPPCYFLITIYRSYVLSEVACIMELEWSADRVR